MPAQTTYDEDIVSELLERIASGETLLDIIESDRDKFPSRATVYRWVDADCNGMRDRYARARRFQAEAWADRIVSVASRVRIGTKTKTTDDGTEITEGDMIERSRLEVDTLKWLMPRLDPKWREKFEQAITGADGKAIAAFTFVIDRANQVDAPIEKRVLPVAEPEDPARALGP